MVDGCFHCRRWILQKPLQFAIHDSKETIPVLFGTIQCFGDGTTTGAQGGWKLGWGRLTHTQESNEPRAEMTNWSWKIKRILPNHQLLHWKLEETPAVDPWKHPFCVVSRWSNKFKTRAFKALEVSRKCFMAQQVTIFLRYENFRKQKQDKLRIYLQESCQLRSSCRIHIQPLFLFTCLYFPCPSPGVPKHQLLCRELAPPRKKTWRNLHSVRQVVCFGMVRDSHLLTSNDSFKTLLQESTKTSKKPTQRSMRLGWGLNDLHKKSPYCFRQSVKKRKKRSRHGKEIDMSQV